MEPPHKVMDCQVMRYGMMSRGRSNRPRKPQIIERIQQFDRAGLQG
jgi:hypothetical protein